MTLGEKIIEEVGRQNLVSAHPVNGGPMLFMWSANAPEQLEAVVEEFQRCRANEVMPKMVITIHCLGARAGDLTKTIEEVAQENGFLSGEVQSRVEGALPATDVDMYAYNALHPCQYSAPGYIDAETGRLARMTGGGSHYGNITWSETTVVVLEPPMFEYLRAWDARAVKAAADGLYAERIAWEGTPESLDSFLHLAKHLAVFKNADKVVP